MSRWSLCPQAVGRPKSLWPISGNVHPPAMVKGDTTALSWAGIHGHVPTTEQHSTEKQAGQESCLSHDLWIHGSLEPSSPSEVTTQGIVQAKLEWAHLQHSPMETLETATPVPMGSTGQKRKGPIKKPGYLCVAQGTLNRWWHRWKLHLLLIVLIPLNN